MVTQGLTGMKTAQKVVALVLMVLLLVTVYAWRRTGQGEEYAALRKARRAIRGDSALVDQNALKSAQQIAQMPTAAEERPFAEQALRLSDFGVDLAFSQALRDAKERPPALSAEAKKVQARLQRSQKLLEADKARVDELDAALDKASAAKKDAIDEALDLVKAQVELDQDEVDDAKQDLIGAGGDPQGRIQAMVQEHENLAKNAPGIGAAPVADKFGLIYRVQQWWTLHQKQMALWKAKGESETRAAALSAKHDALDAQVEAAKANSPALQHHAKSDEAPSDAAVRPGGAAAAAVVPAAGGLAQEDSEELLDKTQRIASNQKTLASYDKQAQTQKDLSDNYAQWIQVVAGKQLAVAHRGLIAAMVILGIALVCVYFSVVLDKVLARVQMDRRQLENLRTVTRVALQIVALLLILLVIVGVPGQLGTFLGLATAGLTVAFKDFIVGFVGWLVLMGKNGIRLGDWVEINGVTGEVMELGMFHTVLLETGNWTDSGHPTGRRVTFTNSFAIEGHYFNFSTSGQWLWDELQVVLPAGQDPYPMVEAIHKQVQEATSHSAQEAASEWKGSAGSREMGAFSVEPSISVKPVVGGIEVAVRYITRANERYQLRSSLYQGLIKLLGGSAPVTAGAAPPPPPGAPAAPPPSAPTS